MAKMADTQRALGAKEGELFGMAEIERRIDRVAEHFEAFVEATPADWHPGGKHARAMTIRWAKGSATAALDDDEFTDQVFGALRKWQAFRGDLVGREGFEAALENARPLLMDLEDVSILRFDSESHGDDLFKLFASVRDVKKTERKWMVCSKLLYHLLPDLVSPMDNKFTAPFLGWRNGLPAGLDRGFFDDILAVYSSIAIRIGQQRLRNAATRFDPKLGLARTIDFAITRFIDQTRS